MTKKVLFVLTSHDQLGNTGHKVRFRIRTRGCLSPLRPSTMGMIRASSCDSYGTFQKL